MMGSVDRHGLGTHPSPMRAELAARLAPWVGEVGSPSADAREHLRALRDGNSKQAR
jgi:hypothetical protein